MSLIINGRMIGCTRGWSLGKGRGAPPEEESWDAGAEGTEPPPLTLMDIDWLAIVNWATSHPYEGTLMDAGPVLGARGRYLKGPGVQSDSDVVRAAVWNWFGDVPDGTR
ncbi:MAG: hypothetical protein H7831_06355 [Magnetococcus sp. WYHC-3]